MEQYKNEIDLLLACCRRATREELAESITAASAQDLDWDFLIRVSYRNAVFPLFFTNLLKAEPHILPDDIGSMVSDGLKHHTETNLFLTSQLFRIIKTFQAADIPLLPFKGALLSIQAYGDPALRMFGDLDLLVQPKHLDEAIQLLQKSGYRPVTSVSWLQKSNWYISRQKDVHFVDENKQTILELHWKLSGSHFGLPKEMNRLWDRLESVCLAGTHVPNLSFNDLLIYLCLHGSRHSWERFGWICDVYYLLTSREEIDWVSILAESKRLGCENVVALGLKLVNEFFEYPIPRVFADSMTQNPVYSEMVDEVRRRIFASRNVQVELADRYAYHLKLKERRLDRWKLHVHYLSWYLRIIMKPNRVDRDVLNLPKLLHPVYFVTRPIRLAYTYLFRPDSQELTSAVGKKQNISPGDVVS
jgi:hypothetical protein